MAADKKTTKKTSRVLVADDSITIQKLVNLTFASTAYEVIAAADGHDALMKIRSLKPEVVFLAAELPQVDGFKICEMLRKDSAFEGIKVVILRTSAQKDATARAKGAGADDVLLKPFDSQLLLRTVENLKGPANLEKSATSTGASLVQASSSKTKLNKNSNQANDEESTVTILVQPREDSATISLVEPAPSPASSPASSKAERDLDKQRDLHQKLEQIAAAVVSERENPEIATADRPFEGAREKERDTFKISPKNFKYPVNESPAKPSLRFAEEASGGQGPGVSLNAAPDPTLVEKMIQEWIQQNLPTMAERILKEEIAKSLR